MSLARWPPKFAYHVWLWTMSAPLTAAPIDRLIDIACSAADSGFGSDSTLQGSWLVTPGSCRGKPQQWTETSARRRSSRARYSTWVPAPPYTSGGYSRVNSATLRRLLITVIFKLPPGAWITRPTVGLL